MSRFGTVPHLHRPRGLGAQVGNGQGLTGLNHHELTDDEAIPKHLPRHGMADLDGPIHIELGPLSRAVTPHIDEVVRPIDANDRGSSWTFARRHGRAVPC
jgi:hypothetical protein